MTQHIHRTLRDRVERLVFGATAEEAAYARVAALLRQTRTYTGVMRREMRQRIATITA